MSLSPLSSRVSRMFMWTLVPLLLLGVLNLTVMVRMADSMRRDAGVINFSGLVRGSIQRLVKLELAGIQDEALTEEISTLIQGFRDQQENMILVGAAEHFADSYEDFEGLWHAVRDAIHTYRAAPSQESRRMLIATSERAWREANLIVFSAQSVSENKQGLFTLIMSLVAMDIVVLLLFVHMVRKYVRNHLEKLAHTDALTGLLNRHSYSRSLSSEVANAQRHGTPLSLILFDLDRFKAINDRFGHPTGDLVLKETAQCLLGRTRGADALFRIGGEEFALILRNTPLSGALHTASSLRERIERHHFNGVGQVTASFGVADFIAGDTQGSLFQRADRALYRAKDKGRNRVESSTGEAPPIPTNS